MPPDALQREPLPGEGDSGPHVPLSYASRDRDRAIAVADALEAAGVRVWIDRRGIVGAAARAGEIAAAIRACRVMVVLCSADSLASLNTPRTSARSRHSRWLGAGRIRVV